MGGVKNANAAALNFSTLYATTTALGSLVGNGVGEFFTNNANYKSGSSSQVKTAFEAGIRATYKNPAFKELGGVEGFAQLTQGYSHDINSSSDKSEMLNRTAMYFQGVTHLLAKDKNLSTSQKKASLNSFTKAFETTTAEHLGGTPYNSASNLNSRINALPKSIKAKIFAQTYKHDTAGGGKAVGEQQLLKNVKDNEKKYVEKNEQGVIDNKIENGVDSRFVK